MKNKKELEQDIIDITTTIRKEFPELSKYITEMPVKDLDQDGIHIKNLEEYYQSLKGLIVKYAKTHKVQDAKNIEPPSLPGYPLYPPSEDIYQQSKAEMDINPEDSSKSKVPNEREGSSNEKPFKDNMSGDDLDIPGSELDDQQESVGSEDEENNYYSIGGDNHKDLEEDKG